MQFSETLLNQYLHTALWSSDDDQDAPLDTDFDIEDISDSLRESSKVDLTSFLKSAGDLLSDTDINTGHDFWLTRCGHGAGFWDGDYDNGDKLTELCKPYRNIDLYIGADGLIYGA